RPICALQWRLIIRRHIRYSCLLQGDLGFHCLEDRKHSALLVKVQFRACENLSCALRSQLLTGFLLFWTFFHGCHSLVGFCFEEFIFVLSLCFSMYLRCTISDVFI